jgi:hypothetical protein
MSEAIDLTQIEALLMLVDQYKIDQLKIGDVLITKTKHSFNNYGTSPAPPVSEPEEEDDTLFFSIPKPSNIDA